MYPSARDGRYGVFVCKLVRGLRARGFCTRPRAVISGLPRGGAAKIAAYARLYGRILRLGATARFDIVVAHYPTHVLLPSWVVARLRGKKLVVAYHGSDLLPPTRSPVMAVTNFLALRVADLVVCPSEFFRRIVLQRCRRPAETVVVFSSCGVNRARFHPGVSRALRAQLGFRPDDWVVGFVSVLESRKGIHEFLAACRLLFAAEPRYRAIVVGDGPERGHVAEAIREPELAGRVVVTGELRHHALPQVLAALDCLAFPTHYEESLGLVALEALSVGVPVIAPAKGAIPEYLRDGVNGLLLDRADGADIAAKVARSRRLRPWDPQVLSRSVERYESGRVLDAFAARLRLVLVEGGAPGPSHARA
jgi:glycosyltransferase involved in cell wall biosynthesis